MAKFVVVAAMCLAAMVVVAIGQDEAERQRLGDLRCWQEVEESPLDACRQVLDMQLAGGGGARYRYSPFRWSAGMRMRCCQQLQDVSRECRCAAIRRMVRRYEQSMPPLEEPGCESAAGRGGGGCSGEEGEGSYGSGEAAGWRRRGDEGCGCGRTRQEEYGESGQGWRWPEFPPQAGAAPRTTRVRLTKVGRYAGRLPTMCQLEPQECSVFSAGRDY